MKYASAILICLVSFWLGGCGWLTSPWTEDPDEKRVPVTPPSEQQDLAEPETQQSPDAESDESEATDQSQEPSARSLSTQQAEPRLVPIDREPIEPARTKPTEPPEDTEQADEDSSSTEPAPRDDSGHAEIVEQAEVVGEPEVVAASMIQVNGRFITIEDVLRSVRPELEKVSDAPEPVFRNRAAQIIAAEIRRQVGQTLLAAEAERRLTDQQKKAVDAELEKMRKEMIASAGGSRTRLEARLREQGVTLDEVVAEQRRYLVVQFYLQSKFMPAVDVTRRELWDYYCEHSDDFTRDKKVQMQLIAAPVRAYLPDEPGEATSLEVAAAREKARDDMEQAVAELRRGRDFA
ncbi:MAG: hypothetical protein ACOC9S_03485, partial [Planctomycetota bacterium]